MRLTATAQYTPRGDVGRFVEARVTPAVRASVQAACDLIEISAKNYVPVDTGRLQESITSEVRETGKTVVGSVAPHTEYAGFVEYGTYKMPAQPYMRPALDENREAVTEIFRSELSLALR